MTAIGPNALARYVFLPLSNHEAIRKILDCLGLPSGAPPIRPSALHDEGELEWACTATPPKNGPVLRGTFHKDSFRQDICARVLYGRLLGAPPSPQETAIDITFRYLTRSLVLQFVPRTVFPSHFPCWREGIATYSSQSLAGKGLLFFLSAAIRATNSMDGVAWCSTHNSVPFAVQDISVPILITGMQGNYFMRDNEIHYELAASAQGFHRD